MSSTYIGLSTVSSQSNETSIAGHVSKGCHSKSNILNNILTDYGADSSSESEISERKDSFISNQLQRRQSSIYKYHKITIPTCNNGEINNINHNDENDAHQKIGGSKLFLCFFGETSCKERNFFYFSLLCTLCQAVLQLIFFLFIVDIIDGFNDYSTYSGAIHLVCAMHPWFDSICGVYIFMVTLFLICILISLIKFVQNLSTSELACSFMKRLNCIVFEKLINKNLSFFRDKTYDTKYLTKLLSKDVKHIKLSIHSLIVLVENVVNLISGLIFLFVINWSIALIIICGFVIQSMIMTIYSKKNQFNDKVRNDKFTIVCIRIAEMIKYIKTIKIFSKEDDESYFYQRCISDAYKYDKKGNTLLYQCYFLLDIVKYITILIVLIIGVESQLTLGILLIDLFILLHVNKTIRKILERILLFLDKYVQSARNICFILHATNVEKIETVYVPVQAMSISISASPSPMSEEIIGGIEMKNIEFAYPTRRFVLKDISIKCESSSLTALVGLNGSEKSMIFKLLMRLYDAQKGEILIDDMDIKKYNVQFLHSNIGYIGSDINIFEGRSIANNIKFAINYGALDSHRFDLECFDDVNQHSWYQQKAIQFKDLENAARIANAYEFIKRLGRNNKENHDAQYSIKITRDINCAKLNQQERDLIICQIRNVIKGITGYSIIKGDMGCKYQSNIVLITITTKTDTLNTEKIGKTLSFNLNFPVEIKEKLNYFKIGCDTIIGGKHGVQLSDGEKQRIAIARAVLFNPKILLIDEAMLDHLDQDSSSKIAIQKSLDTMMMNSHINEKKMCVVVIAHRLSTVEKANIIYVINDGKINDCGTHNALIKKNGLYSKLLRQTFF